MFWVIFAYVLIQAGDALSPLLGPPRHNVRDLTHARKSSSITSKVLHTERRQSPFQHFASPSPDQTQITAIAADAPAILLVAGAGTGKTRVLAARLAHLLRRQAKAGTPLERSESRFSTNEGLMTLVLSFTSTAAKQICDQASSLPGGHSATDERHVWAGTFHSFALRLLSQYPYLGTGLSRFTIADTTDQQTAMVSALKDLSALDNRSPAANWRRSSGSRGHRLSTSDVNLLSPRTAHSALRRVSVWKEQGLDETKVQATLGSARWDLAAGFEDDEKEPPLSSNDSQMERVAAAAYPLYQAHLRRSGKVDFGDLLVCAVKLLGSQPAVLARLHAEIAHVIVDEFQDTSPVQYELMRLIVTGEQCASFSADNPKKSNVVKNLSAFSETRPGWRSNAHSSAPGQHVVRLICSGDDDQSIYAWRGVDAIQNMQRFAVDFNEAVVLNLDSTYRLQPGVLGAASQLIAQNPARFQKPPPRLGHNGPASNLANLELSRRSLNSKHWGGAPSSAGLPDERTSVEMGIEGAAILGGARDPADVQAAATAKHHQQQSQSQHDRSALGSSGPRLSSMAKPYIIIHPCFDGDDEAKFIAHQISQLLLDPVSNPDDLNLKSFAMSLPLASRSSSSTPLIHPSQPTAKPALEKLTVAILVRSAWQFQAFEEQLMLRSVPYVLEGGASFFARPDLRFPLTLLRAITFADDDLAFTEVARHACCGSVGEATLQDLKVLASEQACSLKTASELAVVEGLVKSSRSATGLSDLVSKLNRWRELIKQCLMSTSDPTSLQPDTFDTLGAEALNLPLGSNDAKARLAAVVRQIFYESGYYTFLEQRRKSRSSGGSASVSPQSGKLRGRGSVTRRTKALALSSSDPSKTVDELSRAAGSFESIEAFLRNVALQSGGAAVGGAGAGTAGGGVVVRLMTMHRAKGREFTHVFAAGWEEGVFPLHPGALLAEPVVSSGGRAQAASRRNAEAASASASSDFDTAGTVEEERRLAYVALTRASGSVVLTHAQRRKLQNTWFATRRSRFLAELPNEHVRVSPTIFGAHTNRRPDYLNGPRPVLEFQEEPVRSSSTKIEVGASALRAGKESSVCVSQQLWGYNPWTNSRKEGTFSSALELQEGEENSEFQPRTVQELKSELRAWGLPLSGKKVELMQRLKLHQQQKQSERQRSADAPSDDSVIGGNEVPEYLTQVELERRTVTELKALLRAKGLRISGKKADLVQRALAAPLNPMPVSSSPSAKSGIPLIPTSALQSVQKGQQLDINVNSCDSPAKKVAAWGGAAESAKEAAVLRLSASMSLQQLRASLKARGLRFATGSKMLLARRLHDVILAENAAEHSETQQRHHRKELLPEKEDVSSKDKKSSLAASVLKPPVLINQMKVAALRTELRARGLPQSGTKAELISRLRRASSFFEE